MKQKEAFNDNRMLRRIGTSSDNDYRITSLRKVLEEHPASFANLIDGNIHYQGTLTNPLELIKHALPLPPSPSLEL